MSPPRIRTVPHRGGLRGLLREQLAALSLALLFTVATCLGAQQFVQRIDAAEQRSLEDRSLVGAGVVQQHVLRRLEAVEVLHRLAQSWLSLRESGNREGQAAIETELRDSAQQGRFGIVQVAMIDAEGWMVWSSIGGAARVWLGDREHFQVHQQGRQELFVSRPLLGRVSHRWTLQLTRPMRSGEGRFAGVAVVSLDLLTLSETLAEAQFEQDDSNLVVRRDGIVAARSATEGEGIGSRLPEWDRLRGLPPDHAAGVVHRRRADGSLTVTGWRELPGTEMVAAYALQPRRSSDGFVSTDALVWAQAGLLSVGAFGLVALMAMRSARRRAQAEAVQAEAELRLSDAARQVYAQRIAGLPAVVYGGQANAEGGFALRHVSDSAARIVGWSAEDLLRPDLWRELREPDAADGDAAFFAAVLAQGEGVREYRVRHAAGHWVWVRDSVRLVGRDQPGGAEVVGYIADISEGREIQAKAQANAKLATLGEMATGMAHELNQPLTVISLAADNAAASLQRRGAEAIGDACGRLTRIAQQAKRARDIVDHLRLFGRRDEGEVEPVALRSAVEGASVLTAGALRAARVSVELSLPEDLPPVLARLVPLEQALVNLLLNARDALEPKVAEGAEGRIRIEAHRDGDAVVLSVADNGGGIPEHALERIFEPFFTTKPPGKGTGLGLAICHATMRAFGGALAVRNGSEGAIFELRFRLATTPAQRQAESVAAE